MLSTWEDLFSGASCETSGVVFKDHEIIGFLRGGGPRGGGNWGILGKPLPLDPPLNNPIMK